MARVKQFDSTLKLSICKKGKTEAEERYNYDNKIVGNTICVNSGTTGSGKTVLDFRKTDTFYNINTTNIRVTEKETNPYEVLSMMLPVKQLYHLQALKNQKEEPYTKEVLDGLVKIWHPLVLPDRSDEDGNRIYEKIYKKKNIPINWFSFPIKMPEEVIISILRSDANSDTVAICKDIIKTLKPDESLWEMVDKISNEIQTKQYAVHYDRKYMYTDTGMIGSKRSIENITNNFFLFRDYYCLQPNNFKLEYKLGDENIVVKNLNSISILEMLNDNKHIHQLSLVYYEDDRAKYTVLIYFLILVKSALKSGLVKFPIRISFDELYDLLPKVSKERDSIWRMELSKVISKLLRQLRNSGKGVYVDLFTQDLHKTDTSVISAGGAIQIMKLSIDDKKVFMRDFEWNKSRMDFIDGFKIGETILVDELQEHEGTKYLVAMPRFRVPEDFEDSFEEFSKEYPQRMKSYNDLYKNLIKHRDGIEKKAKSRFKDRQIEKKKLEQKKVAEKENKIKEKIETEIKLKADKEDDLESKDKRKEECYKLKRDNPKISFKDISIKVGISTPSAIKYCFHYAIYIEDWEFLKREGKEHLIPDGVKF